jgi:hypothetical protein
MLEENLTKISDQRRKIHNEIQEERRKINAHLDQLEEQAIGNLDDEEAKIKSEITKDFNIVYRHHLCFMSVTQINLL